MANGEWRSRHQPRTSNSVRAASPQELLQTPNSELKTASPFNLRLLSVC